MPKPIPPLVEAHAGLIRRQWRSQALSVSQVLDNMEANFLKLDDLQTYARVVALAHLVSNGSPADADCAFSRMGVLPNRRIRSHWIRLGVSFLIGADSPASTTIRRNIARALKRALCEDQADTSIWVDALRITGPASQTLVEILDEIDAEPSWWLSRDRLLPVLGAGLVAGLEGARQALDQVLRNAGGFSKNLLKALSSQLRHTTDDQSFAAAAYQLALVVEDMQALHHLAKGCSPPTPPYFAKHLDQAHALVRERSARDSNEVVRRHAIDAWRHLVRLGVVPAPAFEELLQRYRAEGETRARIAWLRFLADLPESDISILVELLLDIGLHDPEPGLRDHAGRLLLQTIEKADEPSSFLSSAITVTTRPTVGPHRAGLLSLILSPLCQTETVELVLVTIEEVFDACLETDTSIAACQEVGNKLTSVLVKAFHLASTELRDRLVDGCRRWPYELGRVPIAAAYALPEAELHRRLDEMMDDDAVPERTRDLIRRHKYYTERPAGSRGYPELYNLSQG